MEMSSYPAGTPSWVDLTTSDPEGARAFYGALFGWDFDIGGPETGHYTMCRLRGQDVAGLGGMPAPEGMPTVWTTYLASDDVQATGKLVTDSGGTLIMEPMQVMEFGSMLIGTDPVGAAFGAWQAGTITGAQLVNEPGSIVWNELATPDLDAAQAFYSKLFDYGWDDVDTGEGGPRYRTFSVGGRTVGGALQMDEQWQGVPPHWMLYFEVGDVDAAVESVQRLGGGVGVPPTDSAFGRFAVVSDPQGAHFTVMASTAPNQQ